MDTVVTRMASLVIPNTNHQGDDLSDVQQQAIEMFMLRFGGATMYECAGFWSKSDSVIHGVKIDIAMDTLDETSDLFLDIVRWVANECGVHSIMATTADGDVFFIEGDLYDGTKII